VTKRANKFERARGKTKRCTVFALTQYLGKRPIFSKKNTSLSGFSKIFYFFENKKIWRLRRHMTKKGKTWTSRV